MQLQCCSTPYLLLDESPGQGVKADRLKEAPRAVEAAAMEVAEARCHERRHDKLGLREASSHKVEDGMQLILKSKMKYHDQPGLGRRRRLKIVLS